jgi:hypothetical protein
VVAFRVICTSLLTFLIEATALLTEMHTFRSSPINPTQRRARPRRLINTHTFQLEELPYDNDIPPYAILSHCWQEGEEISYKEMVEYRLGTDIWTSILFHCLYEDDFGEYKSGYKKIVAACWQARQDGYVYIWIDTCCIDKGNHGQLSQDINSMFDYYKNSEVCYVYLNDYDSRRFNVHNIKWESQQIPRWFYRGWTLQELLAPSSVKFFDAKWKHFGDRNTLSSPIGYITGIPEEVLELGVVSKANIAQRMSWTIHRQTTREEDRAYCLLGLLDVMMEPRYGEGVKSAFERLLNVLRKRYSVLETIFEAVPCQGYSPSGSEYVASYIPHRGYGSAHRNLYFQIITNQSHTKEGSTSPAYQHTHHPTRRIP